MPLLNVNVTYEAGSGVARGVETVAEDETSVTIALAGPGNVNFAFQVLPNWNTTCWYDEDSLEVDTITIYFSNPAPSGGGKLKWWLGYF